MTAEKEYNFYDLFIPLTTRKVFVFITLIGVFVYFNALFGKFVWDDIVYIELYSQLHSFTLIDIFSKNYFNTGSFYRPLNGAYFATLYHFFGTSTFFYHLLQLIVHIGNTLLLFLLFRKYIRIGIAFVFALLFLLHPIQVESVSYIGASASGIVFLLGISSLLLSMRQNLSLLHYAVIVIFLSIAFLFKETALQFLFLLVLVQALFYRKRILRFILLCLLIISPYLSLRLLTVGFVAKREVSNVPVANMDLLERIIQMPAVILYYIKTLIFPLHLAFNQFWTVKSMTATSFFVPLLIDAVVVIALCGIGWVCIRKKKESTPWFIFYFAWLVLGFGFYLQIIPLDMTVADRWFYIPFAGLLGVLALGYQSLSLKRTDVKRAVVYLAIIIVSLFAVRSMIRNADWHDPYTLYSRDVRIEDNYQNTNSLGVELIKQQRYKEGLVYIEKSIRDHPQGSSIFNMGSIYEALKDDKKAESAYRRLIINKEGLATTPEITKLSHDGVIRILFARDDFSGMETFLKEALKRYPKDSNYHAYLAVSLYREGKVEEAEEVARKAAALQKSEMTTKLLKTIQERKPLNLRL